MRFLRTNTAARVTVGPFFDKTDGVTPETALTVTACKLTLMVDDANVPTIILDVAPTASGGANDMVHVTGDDAGFYDLELAAANVNYLGRAMLAITDAATHCPVFHEFMIVPAMVYDSMILGTDTLNADVTQFGGTNLTAAAGIPEVKVASIAASAITAAAIATDAIDADAIAANAIDAGAIAADAITAAKLAADVTTEIQSGLATAAALTTVDDFLDTEIAAIKAKTDQLTFTVANQVDSNALSGGSGLDAAGVRAAIGLASANLDTQLDALPTNAELATALGTADDAVLAQLTTLAGYVDTEVAAIKAKTDNLPTDPADASDIAASFVSIASTLSTLASYVDTEVAAIKAKTDSLTFTVAGAVDANIQRVNDVAVVGTGAPGDEWGA